MLHCFGRVNFFNGDIYDGMMREGVLDGFGVFYQKKSNKWIYGKFEKNNCIEALQTGRNFPKQILSYFYPIIYL